MELAGDGNTGRHRKPINYNSFSEAIRDVLSEHKKSNTVTEWDIVHYAGHSFYDSEAEIDPVNGKTGYIVIPGDGTSPSSGCQYDKSKAEYLDVLTFSKCLREAEVKFLYLSSCDSSVKEFVLAVTDQKIPSLIGFSWDLDDELAGKFAEKFYEKLFEVKALERAFLAARRQLNMVFSNNPIWASPILVLQVET